MAGHLDDAEDHHRSGPVVARRIVCLPHAEPLLPVAQRGRADPDDGAGGKLGHCHSDHCRHCLLGDFRIAAVLCAGAGLRVPVRADLEPAVRGRRTCRLRTDGTCHLWIGAVVCRHSPDLRCGPVGVGAGWAVQRHLSVRICLAAGARGGKAVDGASRRRADSRLRLLRGADRCTFHPQHRHEPGAGCGLGIGTGCRPCHGDHDHTVRVLAFG